MMDASVARAIMDAEAMPMARALGIGDFDLRLAVVTVEAGKRALCSTHTGYQWVRVELDPAQHGDEAALRETLRHELLHGTHAPWTHYSATMEAALGEAWPDGLDDEAYAHAAEQHVRRLEKMLDAIGLTPERLVEIGRTLPAGGGGRVLWAW